MKFKIRNSITLLLCLYLVGCKERVTQEALIKSAVEIKLDQWRTIQIKTCREKILLKAEDYVDSFLVATALQTKLDTIPKLPKPVKPPKPEFRIRPDSVKVGKIYK